jgi:hypothetical protein
LFPEHERKHDYIIEGNRNYYEKDILDMKDAIVIKKSYWIG